MDIFSFDFVPYKRNLAGHLGYPVGRQFYDPEIAAETFVDHIEQRRQLHDGAEFDGSGAPVLDGEIAIQVVQERTSFQACPRSRGIAPIRHGHDRTTGDKRGRAPSARSTVPPKVASRS